ncbi:MAG: heavy metal-associated domain-containing protein [bacterium]
MGEAVLKIEGMHCDGCAERIRTVLEREPGVRSAEVSFTNKQARVKFNLQRVDDGRLVELVETAGFEVTGREA